MIFCIDNAYFDINGNAVPDEFSFHKNHDDDDDDWYQYWMDDEGLPEPLKAESTVEPEWEIDDAFGNFGFKNKDGEFIIEPQYAYAHEFTCGLASVNLNRTWYRTPEGRRYYENHYGYIDGNGDSKCDTCKLPKSVNNTKNVNPYVPTKEVYISNSPGLKVIFQDTPQFKNMKVFVENYEGEFEEVLWRVDGYVIGP